MFLRNLSGLESETPGTPSKVLRATQVGLAGVCPANRNGPAWIPSANQPGGGRSRRAPPARCEEEGEREMGAQFSEEFLLGYRPGHRDGFADAVLLMRDAVTLSAQAATLARREAQLSQPLSGDGLLREDGKVVSRS